ncbi:hypothetical protein TNCV_4989871 [Trichonephila clavipes]|uniref:Uncharacterized protein n=1 Tax=Trichonephila clavipes TaxID=2585209 RepID=A0A8X7BHJ8_TRICX|nr:hypothetical protein TNCV_4989871 [Trichonephila clavipes]
MVVRWNITRTRERDELADMHLVCEPTDCSGQAAQWIHVQRYPRRQTLTHAPSLHACMAISFIVDTQELNRTVKTPNNEETALDMVPNIPGMSMGGYRLSWWDLQ